MPTTKVDASGQASIPQEILDFLKLHPGDEIDFQIASDGKVIVQSLANEDVDEIDESLPRLQALQEKLKTKQKIKIEDLKGVLHREGMKPLTVEEMDEAIGRYLAKKHQAIKDSWQE